MTNFDSTSTFTNANKGDTMAQSDIATADVKADTLDLEAFSIEVMCACDTFDIEYVDHVEAALLLREEEPAVFDSIRKGNGWVPAPVVEVKLDTKTGLVMCAGE